MVKVVTFAVSLHHVGAFFIVDVANVGAGVWADSFPVQPVYISAANGVWGKGAEVRNVEGLGVEPRADTKNTAAGRGGEHGVAEAVDEVRRCGGLADGSNEV
jgi:hypothetical protein